VRAAWILARLSRQTPTATRGINLMGDAAVDEDWEDWDPSSTSFATHVVAGSCAGLLEHVLLFPVDTLKTHLQVNRSNHNMKRAAKDLLNARGFKGMWRGASTMVTACIPAHASYFTIYEVCKEEFGANGPGHTPIGAAASGIIATVAHDAIMTPMDVMKQRLQLGYYAGMGDCFRQVLATEGLGAFFISYPTTLLMNVPYAAILVASHESLKLVLNPSGGQNVPAFLLSGAISGTIAAAVTNPMDVVKTRLQTQGLTAKTSNVPPSQRGGGGGHLSSRSRTSGISRFSSVIEGKGSSLVFARHKMGSAATAAATCPSKPRGYSIQTNRPLGLWETVQQIRSQEGYRGFLKGLRPRIMTHAPAMGISWGTYETVKRFLSNYI